MESEGGNSSHIFCLTWVKRNAAKMVPDQIGLDPEEMQKFLKNEEITDENEWMDVDDSETSDCQSDHEQVKSETDQKFQDDDDDDLKEYNMDHYDDEEENVSGGVAGLVMFANNDDDPYLVKKSKLDDLEDSEGEDEEKAAINLKPDDNLLACARCSQYSNILEVYVYNHSSKDFYVHHDVPLAEVPLCMEWVGFDPGAGSEGKGNLLAVGNFCSTIDIWDLDILNTIEPVFTIGKKSSVKKKKQSAFCHTDAVLDLAWSENMRDKLASASADTTVALWDLELGKAERVFDKHNEKVQSIEWKPLSLDCLLSGTFNGKVRALDVRASKIGAEWSVDGEVERVMWNPLEQEYFVASTDKGIVYYMDCRKPGAFLHHWAAHEAAIPGLVISRSPSKEKTLLYTASSDGYVKLWDLNENEASEIHKRKMKMGMVHCSRGNPDVGSVIAFGGQRDNVKLWDITKTPAVSNYLNIKRDSDAEDDDTIDPLGGAFEEDDDVIKYLGGEDYINEKKLERAVKSAEDNQTGKKKRKRKKKKSLPQKEETAEKVDAEINSENVENKKKRRRRKKTKPPAEDA